MVLNISNVGTMRAARGPAPVQQALAWSLVICVFGVMIGTSALTTLDGLPTEYIRCGEAVFVSAALWTFLLAIGRRVGHVLALATPVAMLLPIELWMRIAIGSPTTTQFMALALETTPAEIVNFFATYGSSLIPCWVAWLVFYGLTLWMAYRHVLKWSNRGNIFFIVFIPAVFAIRFMDAGSSPWFSGKLASNAFQDEVLERSSQEWQDAFPFNVVVAFHQYELEMRRLKLSQDSMAQRTYTAYLRNPAGAPEVVILVVGESATATRWSLLGYPRKTTPRLEAEGNSLVFSDVTSLSVSTRTAVPGVLSHRPIIRPDDVVDDQATPSLIKAFGEAGYQTHWFSNQSPFGVHDTSIAVYAREAQDVRFFNPATFKSKASLDEVLLAPLRAALNTSGRHLVVLHLQGSHSDYALRYPEAFDYFKPSTKNVSLEDQWKSDRNERIGNTYDNSILYTDYILSETIATAKARGGRSVVAYFSDHGVDLPGGSCPYRVATRYSVSAYQVPVLFWFSDSMRRERLSEWLQLQANQHAPYRTRAMFSTLIDLAGIDVTIPLPDENFLRRNTSKDLSRMISVGNKMINFEAAKAHDACKLFTLQ